MDWPSRAPILRTQAIALRLGSAAAGGEADAIHRVALTGEGTPANDGQPFYSNDDAYRLRILYSGGFSPNRVRSILPGE